MSDRGREGDFWGKIREDLQGMEDQYEEAPDRIPCSDGSCIGLVGDDGCCRVCGRQHAEAYVSSFGVSPCQDFSDRPMIHEESEGEEEEEHEEDSGLDERVLCSDESCIGVVDEDGYCKACGLKWKPQGYQDGEPLLYREDEDE
ncbi:MAG: hypothetical protein ACUVXD_06650 [Thermodesulfobacteriota bacterium]